MYRAKTFRVRPLEESLAILEAAGQAIGHQVEKLFVADGDALVMDLAHWEPILQKAYEVFPRLRRVSCYAMASNVLEKSDDELHRLRELGLSLLYLGPESGDPVTLKRIVKGGTFEEHVEAARRAHDARMKISVITLLGAGGIERSQEHAEATARLVTEMDPDFLAALTLTVVPGTPMERMESKGKFVLPDILQLLGELRTIVADSRPTRALFRTNHASNYLPLRGELPADRERIVGVLDAALRGDISLRPEWSRGL
jgi:radical SAM superfamily enzyme YgiQ (UPF0313 family)